MKVMAYMKMPFSYREGWRELQAKSPSIPLLAWCVVLPMSLLPPVMLYFAGTHYGDAFMTGFADREWRFITTILFLAELLTFFIMGWVIHAVVNGTEQLSINYQDAYLLAALAPLPLWASSLALGRPSWLSAPCSALLVGRSGSASASTIGRWRRLSRPPQRRWQPHTQTRTRGWHKQ